MPRVEAYEKQSHRNPDSTLALAVFAGSMMPLLAQVILHPNQIQGTIRFSNVDPAILGILDAPGNQGFTNVSLKAVSRPPAPALVQQRLYTSTTSRTSQAYDLTVESSPAGGPGIVYDVSATIWLDSKKEQYTLEAVTSPPVIEGGAPATVDLTECVGLFDVRFVDSASAPVAIQGGHIEVHPLSSPSTLAALATIMDPGATQNYLAVPGGVTCVIDIYFQIGAAPSLDQITFHHQATNSAPCDQIVAVNCVVPGAGSLGRIVASLACRVGVVFLAPGSAPARLHAAGQETPRSPRTAYGVNTQLRPSVCFANV
jgi:hypothetical protein